MDYHHLESQLQLPLTACILLTVKTWVQKDMHEAHHCSISFDECQGAIQRLHLQPLARKKFTAIQYWVSQNPMTKLLHLLHRFKPCAPSVAITSLVF